VLILNDETPSKQEGKKIGEVAAGGVVATAVCTGAVKVVAPCLGTAAIEALPVALPVMEAAVEEI
jgi:hypothetical protein